MAGPPVPVRHLYLHLPFCSHRCGYCDFVTAVGATERHAPYVDALLADLETTLPLVWGRKVVSIFIGGGTPNIQKNIIAERILRLPKD